MTAPDGTLDLTKEGIGASPYAARYDESCLSNRKSFVTFIDEISERNTDNIDWWVSSASSRNEILSRLFHDFVVVGLVARLLDDEELPGSLLVDSAALEGMLKRLIRERGGSPGIRFQHKYSALSRALQSVRGVLSPLRSAGRLFYEWTVVRIQVGNASGFGRARGGLILIDTFALSEFPERDRYFPGLLEHADTGERERIRFVPQFWGYRIPQLPRFVRGYAKCEGRYLFKEQLLSIRDLCWSVLHVWRRRCVDLQGAHFEGCDYSDVIRHDLKQSAGTRCAMRGLLNYRFIMNLKGRGVEIARCIDWFENHPMDRGWNAGVNRAYGSDMAIGYQGFYPALDAARITSGEYRSQVTPGELFIMGPGFEPETKEFCPELKTSVGPAFRYPESSGDGIGRRSQGLKDILVALPYSKPSARYVCRIVAKLATAYPDRRFIVKPHPAHEPDSHALVGQQDNLMVVQDRLSNWFSRVSLAICGAESTVALEAMVNGKSVIVVGERGGMQRISIPAAAPAEFWRPCANVQEVKQAIADLESSSESQSGEADVGALQNLFFTPVTKETVRALLSPQSAMQARAEAASLH